MDLDNLIQQVQSAAKDASSGDPVKRTELLKVIRNLNHAVELPTETLQRITYQVYPLIFQVICLLIIK